MELLLVGLVCLAALAWVVVKKTSKNDDFSSNYSAPYKVEPPVKEEVSTDVVETAKVEETAKTAKKARKPRATKSAVKSTVKTKKTAVKAKKKLV